MIDEIFMFYMSIVLCVGSYVLHEYIESECKKSDERQPFINHKFWWEKQ